MNEERSVHILISFNKIRKTVRARRLSNTKLHDATNIRLQSRRFF
jgi:hypothetical protein